MIVSMSPDAKPGRSRVGSSTLNDAGAWNSKAFGRGWRAGVSGAGEPAAAGGAGSVAGVVASAGGAVGIAGTVVTAVGADRLAPGIVAAGAAVPRAMRLTVPRRRSTRTSLPATRSRRPGRTSWPTAAGAEPIDGASAAVVALKDVSEPAGATGKLAIGCASRRGGGNRCDCAGGCCRRGGRGRRARAGLRPAAMRLRLRGEGAGCRAGRRADGWPDASGQARRMEPRPSRTRHSRASW